MTKVISISYKRESIAQPCRLSFMLLNVTRKEGKILGTSKVGPKYRITLVKDVQERLKVKVGDMIVYFEEPDGKIVLRAVSYEQLLKTARK